MNSIRLGERDVPWTLISKPIRNLYLRIRPEGFLQITAPVRTSSSDLERFIRRFEDKIRKELDRLETVASREKDTILVFGERIPVVQGIQRKGILVRNGKWEWPATDDESVRTREKEIWYGHLIRSEVDRILIERAVSLKADFDLEGIVVKTQRMTSRLGSCKIAEKVIKLNTVLGRFDRRYLEAILLHELCHLRVPNHGPAFYRLLEKHVPEYRFLRRELHEMVKTIGV